MGANIEEVIVTAQKRSETIHKVPLPITALTKRQLLTSGSSNLEDAALLVSSFQVQSSNGSASTNYRLRRIGNLGNIPTFEPAVSVYVDGAYRVNPIFTTADFLDVSRIEILRGPQSTLYGKNATAGVIAMHSTLPGQQPEHIAEVTAGVIDSTAGAAPMYRLKAGASSPLSSTVSASLNAVWTQHEDTFDSAVDGVGEEMNDDDSVAVKAQLSGQFGEAFSWRSFASRSQVKARQQAPETYLDPDGFVANQLLPAFQAAGVAGQCNDNDARNRSTCLLAGNLSNSTADSLTLNGQYRLENSITVDTTTSWDRFRYKGTQLDAAQVLTPLLVFQDTQEAESFQQELRITSAQNSQLEWMTGLFYYRQQFDRGDGGRRPVFLGDTASSNAAVAAFNQLLFGAENPVPFATTGQLGFLDSRQNTRYVGAFGQARWYAGDALDVTVEVRWQEERKRAYIRQSVNDPSPSVLSLLLSPSTVSAEGLARKADDITWAITPRWNVTETATVYSTVSSGFKSGGFNTGFGGLPIAAREFEDETLTHYEMGFKGRNGDNSITYATAVFLTDFENYQDAAFIGSQFTVGNAQKVELLGVEFDSSVALGENWTGIASISYADLIYKKNLNGQCFPGRVPNSPLDPTACDLSGERPINAPKWTGAFALRYEHKWQDNLLAAQVDWSWSSKYNASFSADPALVQGHYHRFNLNLSLERDAFSLALWAKNLTDETVVDAAGLTNIYTGDQSHQSFLQPARSVGVTLRMGLGDRN
ncbi:MAG: TonB-dependent receptor [Halioglobus sp.]